MLVVLVYVHVKPEYIDAFRDATIANASASIKEAGIVRFDIVQQQDDPTRFVLIEAYRNADAPVAHKGTLHYLTWCDTVADMMAEPRTSTKYENTFPDDKGWG